MMRVLIADDDPIIRLDLTQTLSNLKYDVVAEAGNGADAVRLAIEEKPDICILDVKMPEKDGIEAAREITELEIAPVVLLTAFSDEELVRRATDASVYAYLVKPYNPASLAPAIEIAISRFAMHKQLSKELDSVTEKLEVRKLLDRAKGILMQSMSIDEPEAYRRIQTQSMNNRKSMREVAEAVIIAKEVQEG